MSGRVLVVDDSATIRRLVRSILEEAGYEVSSAPDGQAALDLMQRESFDAALLDFVMPRLNGYQLAQAIRAMPALRTLPLVLMSAKADVIGPRFLQQTHAAHSITKPFEPNALLAVVGHALSAHTRPTNQPVTLVNEELGRTASIPPPSPQTTTTRPGPRLSAAPSPTAKAAARVGAQSPTPVPQADPSLAPPPVPRDRSATVLARPRLDTSPTQAIQLPTPPRTARDESAHATLAVAPWMAGLEESEQTVVGLLPVEDSEVTGEGSAAIAEADRRIEALERFAQSLVGIIGRALPTQDPKRLALTLADRLDSEDLHAIAESVKSALAVLERDRRVGLEGDIELVPLGEVLQMLRFQQQTGVLAVKRGDAAVELCFYRGSIELALARNVSPEFLLGRYAVAAGVITRDELDGLLRSGVRGRLGDALIEAGRLDKDSLERLLTRQSSEILYEVCRWRDGSFEFIQGLRRPEAEAAALGLPVEALVLEGFRRVDEWGQIEQEVRSFDDVFAVDHGVVESVGVARLSPSERRVLDALDGQRTINELIARTHMNSFDVCKTVFQLRRARLIRRRSSA
ncbi:MAG: response regulator [Myxococcales bacterium]|nr:response regulator [Myxococcales bacterium]